MVRGFRVNFDSLGRTLSSKSSENGVKVRPGGAPNLIGESKNYSTGVCDSVGGA